MGHLESPWTRRRLIALCGLGAVAFAGCVGGDDTNGSDGADDGAGDTGDDAENAVDSVSHPGEEAIDVPGEVTCPVCSMRPSQYADWNAQLAHADETGVFFDTAGCLFAYVADPSAFDGPTADVVGAWVTDLETRETIDATEATFVREHDDARLNDPMDLNPAPFYDRDDAIAYVDTIDDLSEDDLMEFDDIGSDEADLYRGGR